jgi:2-phospho-L-lactate/phosphoenolpyruvate guanylyltransferase
VKVWVIIPVKPLKRAKSRLALVLTSEERFELAQRMLIQVLSVVKEVPRITGTLVVSRDLQALSIARQFQANTLQESRSSALNQALTRATGVVRGWGADAVLVLPADLPFITEADIEAMVQNLGRYSPAMVIAPDRHHDGTNALLLRPPGWMQYRYGNGSYTAHIEQASQFGVPYHVYEKDTVELDIDTPDDLLFYNGLVEAGSYTELRVFPAHEVE